MTQIVLRVFEDNNCEIADPQRFRVEILFSPGATATPVHLDETVRDFDATRFDTAPLQLIGRDDLTCAELEEFFANAIADGRALEDDDDADAKSMTPSIAAASKSGEENERTTGPAATSDRTVQGVDHHHHHHAKFKHGLAHKRLWSMVALGSIAIGAALIVLAIRQSEKGGRPRSWATKE